MGVPHRLFFGILLVWVIGGEADQLEQPPPLQTAPNHTVTEIDNRDLNKIVSTNPKTESLEPKTKTATNTNNNVDSFETFPIKLAKSEREPNEPKKLEEEEEEEEGEEEEGDEKANSQEIVEILSNAKRDDEPKTNQSTSSKPWLPPPPLPPPSSVAIEKSFAGTRHPSFEDSVELTTPISHIFDQKFKETKNSVEQKLENISDEQSHRETEEDEDRGGGEEGGASGGIAESSEENLTIESRAGSKARNDSREIEAAFEKTKSLITKSKDVPDKNSIHKDVDFILSKKFNFENAYNETKLYDQKKEDSAEESSERISTAEPEKMLLKKNTAPSIVHFLSNNIETESGSSEKSTIATTTSSPTTSTASKFLITVAPKSNHDKHTSAAASTETTVPNSSTIKYEARANIPVQENIISSKFSPETSTWPEKYSTFEKTTPPQKMKSTQSTSATEPIPTTTTVSFETTTDDFSTSTTLVPEITTTMRLPLEDYTEIFITTTGHEVTMAPGIRTSKSLETTNTEEVTKEIATSTVYSKNLDVTETESTTKNELDGAATTADHFTEIKIEGGATEPMRTTTVEFEETTTLRNAAGGEKSGVTTQKIVETSQTPMEVKTLTVASTLPTVEAKKESGISPKVVSTATTTEVTFIHTTRTPNPSYTHSTPNENNNGNTGRKVPIDNGGEMESSATSSSSTASTVQHVETTTADDKTTPTENTFIKEDPEGSDTGNKGKIAAIVISSVGALCLVLLAGLLYIMKKRQRRLNYGPRCRPVSLDDYSIDNLSVYNSVRRKGAARASKRSFGNPAFEDPVAPTHPLNFQALAKFATNYEDIRAEFEEIPQISAKTSELPEGCDTRNRYANVIPLPETRVYLKSIDGYPNSDYINANYVTGPKNIKGYYIATQGPMQNTVDDFWRMVWEQQARVILMLTHLIENGLEKCVDYLPESDVLECNRVFGDFQITLKKREVKEKYIISSLQLKNMVSNSWREVHHFWYLGWPEKGVPSEANSLIAFLIEARSYMKTTTLDKTNGVSGLRNGALPADHNPVIVHCSPGTGRTGVAIACDIAIREFETTRLVDIPRIVYRIRRDRANAIQTKEQYSFIYKVVSLYATKLTGGALDNI